MISRTIRKTAPVILLILAGATHGQVPREMPLSGFIPAAAGGMVRGDIDNDGRMDLILLPGFSEDGQIWSGGESGFADSGQRLAGLADDPTLADFDNDGDLDLFGRQVATPPDPSRYALWINENGVLQLDGDLVADVGQFATALDHDYDGDLDVVYALGNAVMVLANNGAAGFGTPSFLFSETVDGLTGGDLDGDGDADIIAALRTGWRGWINQGGLQAGASGTFVGGPELGMDGVAIRTPRLADVDGDRDLDLYIASAPFAGTHADTLWINQGGLQQGDAGEFSISSGLFPDVGTRSVDSGDADSDGDVDLLLAVDDGLLLLANQGALQGGTAGQFQPSHRYTTPFLLLRALLVADPDRPGRIAACCEPDLVGTLASSVRNLDTTNGPLVVSVSDSFVNMGSVQRLVCSEVGVSRATRGLSISAADPTPLLLNVSLQPGGSAAISIENAGSVSTSPGSQIHLACDANSGPKGVNRATVVITEPMSGAGLSVPVSCTITDNCYDDTCDCSQGTNGQGETCCAVVCGVFKLLLLLVGAEPPFAGKVLGETASTALLRGFRDGPMTNDPVWNYYRMRFLATTPRLIQSMLGDVDFTVSLQADYGPWILALDTITQDAGATGVVTPGMEESLNRVLDFFEMRGDPQLVQEIRFERERLGLDSIAGMSMDEFYAAMSIRGADVGDIFFKVSFE